MEIQISISLDKLAEKSEVSSARKQAIAKKLKNFRNPESGPSVGQGEHVNSFGGK